MGLRQGARRTHGSRVAVAMAGMLISGAAHAGQDVVPDGGAPFCVEQDHLQEYILAALQHDDAWIKQLNDCSMLKAGTRIGVIEELPSQSTLGHISKVREISRGVSAVGYIFLVEKGD
jgi:hypothetical protein